MEPTIVALKSAVTAGKALAGTIAKEGQGHTNDHYAELKQLKKISYSIVESYRTLNSAAGLRMLQAGDVDQVVEAAATVKELVASLRGPSMLQQVMFWKKADARPEANAFRDSLVTASAKLRSAQILAADYRQDHSKFAFNGDDDRQRRAGEVNEATKEAEASLLQLKKDANALFEFLSQYFRNRV